MILFQFLIALFNSSIAKHSFFGHFRLLN